MEKTMKTIGRVYRTGIAGTIASYKTMIAIPANEENRLIADSTYIHYSLKPDVYNFGAYLENMPGAIKMHFRKIGREWVGTSC